MTLVLGCAQDDKDPDPDSRIGVRNADDARFRLHVQNGHLRRQNGNQSDAEIDYLYVAIKMSLVLGPDQSRDRKTEFTERDKREKHDGNQTVVLDSAFDEEHPAHKADIEHARQKQKNGGEKVALFKGRSVRSCAQHAFELCEQDAECADGNADEIVVRKKSDHEFAAGENSRET